MPPYLVNLQRFLLSNSQAIILTFPHSCLVDQSCLTLCNHLDCSLPGFSVCGISQARIPEPVAISSPGDFPDPGSKPTSPESPVSPTLQANSLLTEPLEKHTLFSKYLQIPLAFFFRYVKRKP